MIDRCHALASSRTLVRVLLVAVGMAWIIPNAVQVTLAQECDKFIGAAKIKGRKFFDIRSGSYVPIKGINYYPRPNSGRLSENNIDFFTEEYRAIWERDIAELVKLSVNTVRIYAVDPSLNHDGFFCALHSAGIRVIVGLSATCEDCSIQTKTAAPDCYPGALKTRGQFIIAEFSRYDNVLGFSAANEVGLDLVGNPEFNAPCAKQFLRDMRAFIQTCNADSSSQMRPIPVGLASADQDRQDNALYYNCRSDPDDELENAEWYGLNAYQHCDGTAKTVEELTGFRIMQREFQSYDMTIPVVLSQFGCIHPSFPTIDDYEAQRDFLQVQALFSESFTNDFAGGCVFAYSTEDNQTPSPWPYTTYAEEGNFGVGYFSPEFCDEIVTACEYVPFPQFESLAKSYAAVDVSFVPSMDEYEVTGDNGGDGVPTCPAQFTPLNNFTWESASVADWPCPEPKTVFCPGIPTECGPSPTMAPSMSMAPTFEGQTRSPTSAPAGFSGSHRRNFGRFHTMTLFGWSGLSSCVIGSTALGIFLLA